MVEFDFEAVPIISVGFHLCQGGIAFRTDRYIFVRLIVDDNGAGIIFLIFAVCKELLPVIHNNINCVDARCVKQSVFISGGRGSLFYTEAFCVDKKYGKKQRKHENNTANLIKMLMR